MRSIWEVPCGHSSIGMSRLMGSVRWKPGNWAGGAASIPAPAGPVHTSAGGCQLTQGRSSHSPGLAHWGLLNPVCHFQETRRISWHHLNSHPHRHVAKGIMSVYRTPTACKPWAQSSHHSVVSLNAHHKPARHAWPHFPQDGPEAQRS